MNGVFYSPAGYKHHFRNIEPKNGKADLKDDHGKTVFANVSISTEPKTGQVFIEGYAPAKPKK